MRSILASFGGLALALLAASAAGAAGMGEPVMEGEVVVVETPVVTEPETKGACSAGACAPMVADVGDIAGCSGDDRTPQEQQISQTADGRVLCLTVAAARRGGAGLFDLCQP